jgi:hypothetical protein
MAAPPTQPLTVGAHLLPEDGACLMEAVSVHAGESWSDAPACTHPALGHLARLVNDASSDAGRQRLLELVSLLAATHGTDPATYPRIALACTTMALRHHRSLLLAHLHRAARAELARESRPATHPRGARLRRSMYQRGAALRALEVAVAGSSLLPAVQRDELLLEMLRNALAAATEPALSPVAEVGTGAQART